MRKKFIQRKIAMCVKIPWGFHSAIAFVSLNILSICCFVWRWLDRSEAQSLSEEIILKVIRRDIVIRFNSLTFFWIALSGFQSTGKPFFSQVALSGFQLAVCTDFFCLSLIFAWTALSGFRFTGIPIFVQAAFSGFRLVGCTIFFISSLIFARTLMVRREALIFA